MKSARGNTGGMATVWWIATMVLLVGCTASRHEPSPGEQTAAPAVKRAFDVRGVVVELPAGGRELVVRHEEIPGYMSAMTMGFSVRDPGELRGIAPGDSIAFRLRVGNDESWIDGVRRLSGGNKAATPVEPGVVRKPVAAPIAVGQQMPDPEWVAADGRTARLSDFRGKSVALTFVFTRCPLPDYCPRMGRRFAAARELLRATKTGPTNWQFVTISFDPGNDTPEILRAYGSIESGRDADRWQFASAGGESLARIAGPLDFHFSGDGGTFMHNLRTAVLDPQGRLYRRFDGNQWTAEALAEAMTKAARAH